MRRFLFLAPIAVALVLVPGAAAKGPFQVCGKGGCIVLAEESQASAMPLNLFAVPAGAPIAGPTAPAPYYVIRFADISNAIAYWLPSRSLLRVQDNGGVVWRPTLPSEEAFLREKTAGLTPYPAPKINSVLVNYERVKRPAGYAQLLTMGTPVSGWQPVRTWLDVWLSGPISPWTDGTSTVSIARKGNYLLRNGVVYTIPKAVADRIRKRLPLS